MVTIPPTVTDVSRAILNLGEYGHRGPEIWEDDDRWGVEALRDNAAANIVRWLAPVANLRKVNRREVGLIMASHGAPRSLIANHARVIAKMINRDYAPQHNGGGTLL